MKRFRLAAAWLLLAAAGAWAQPPVTPAAGGHAAAAKLTDGEVLEIDREERRVLIRHGRIESLGMDPMTMEFLVPDAKLLQRLRAGDRIRFAAVWRNDDYEITRAQVLPRKPASR